MKISGRLISVNTVDVIDISLGGVALRTNRMLQIGTEHLFRVETKGHSMSVKGVVVWSTPRETRQTTDGEIEQLYAVGMRYNDLDTKKVNALIEFIESHKLEKDSLKLHSMSGSRFNMRYHLSSNGKFMLTCPEDFLVREISPRDMLIETEHAYELDKELPMIIFLPGNNKISFTGQIVSCKPINAAEPKQVAIGVKFLNLMDESVQKLTGFIGTLY